MTHEQAKGAFPKLTPPSGKNERIPSLDTLQPHDHLSLIYESQEEWRAVIVPFLSQGLQRGEACVYFADVDKAEEARRCLAEAGVDVAAVERSGRLTILNSAGNNLPDSVFSPDGIRTLLLEKTRAALAGGAPALRVFSEMDWILRSRPEPHHLRECEAALCREFFLQHPSLGICAYDRKQFAPALLKQALQSQPFLILGQQVYRNPYFIPHEDVLSPEKDEKEVQRWLDNIMREPSLPLTLEERESLFTAALDRLPVGVAICTLTPAVSFRYMNDSYAWLLRTTRGELAMPDAFWGALFKDPIARERIRRQTLEGCASGNSAQMHWPNLTLECPGEDPTYISTQFFAIPGQPLWLSVVWSETERKRSEEELLNSEQRFRELFENMSSGVAVYEAVDEARDFMFLAFNAAGERIEQIPREQVLGRRVTEVFPGVVDLGLLDILRRVWRTGQPETHPAAEYRDGRLAGWRENRVYKLPSGEIVAVYDDVTEQKKAEKKLTDQLGELRRWSSVMQGREERVLELKREVNLLLRRLGESPKYEITE